MTRIMPKNTDGDKFIDYLNAKQSELRLFVNN
jgi:hypothetical protein